MTLTTTRTDTGVGRATRVGTRLADEDATYWLMREGLGWNVVLQLVWQVPGILDDEVLQAFAGRLSRGRLHRRLLPPRVRGARPMWIESADVVAAQRDTDLADDVEIWAVAQMNHADLDAVAGRCWRLTSASTPNGDTVVSLCALHMVTDGRGLLDAAAVALASAGVPTAPLRPSTQRASRRDDLRDAAGQLRAVATGLMRAVGAARAASSEATAPDPRPPRSTMAERAPRASPAWATATVPADEWDRVAADHGGTANTLFVAVVSGLLRSGGYAPHGVAVKVGVPVDRRRGADDDRANATAGVSVILEDDPVPGGDLSRIRASCKDAFIRLSEGRRPPAVHLQPLIWLLPTRLVVAAATAGSGMPDAVTSNLGDVPDAAMTFGGVRARHLAFRGIADGVDATAPHRFGDGVQSWLVRTEGEVTFSVVGFDEQCFPDAAHLRALLAAELAGWGLTAHIWGGEPR